ncbi:MAG TPA: DNA-formamidopyrimidine glycosylase family protein [Candidatus Dormibacteraeota bacterium]
MPEMPELEALRQVLGPQLEGALVTACEVVPRKAHLLRYPVEEFQQEVPYRRFTRTWRRGKHLVFDLELARGGEPRSLVINPMLGGRFDLASADDKVTGNQVFSLRLEGGRELRYLDFRDMGRIYWTADLKKDVPAWADLGPEADAVGETTLEDFRKRLRRYRDELKDLLRNQAFLAGVGNAYSDEILFEARLLPLRRRPSLKPDEEQALYEAIPTVLDRAVKAILANPDYDESKQDRKFMKVHAKGGQNCPRCGHRISQLGSNREPLNFCRGCQK